jgi:uncharacterized iron-regulated membrane protein
MWLHISLLLGHKFGSQIIGCSVLIFIIMLITGMILWWPKKRKKAIRQRLWFRWKDTTKWKRKNYDLHNILGFYIMIFALIIALTGLVWSYQWVNNSFQWIANGGESSPERSYPESISKSTKASNPLDKLFVELASKHDNYDYVQIYTKGTLDEKGVYNGYIPHNSTGISSSDSYYYDQYTLKEVGSLPHKEKSNGEKLRSMNYDIHTGAILGLPGKILAFFASLVSASLPITGFMIWWGRNKKKRRKNNKKRSTNPRNATRPKVEAKQPNGAVKSRLTQPKVRNTEDG